MSTPMRPPQAGGFVASLARPGGNATGFTLFDYGLTGKMEGPRSVPTMIGMG
jgi:hypothetical protein